MKGILFRTTHTAHLCLTHADHIDLRDTDDVDKELSDHVDKVLALFKSDQVSIDEGFCCNALTEIGIIGNKARCVQEAAELIMKFVEEHEAFQSIEIN